MINSRPTFRSDAKTTREEIIKNLEARGYTTHCWMEVSDDGRRIIYCVEGYIKKSKLH